jgi:hypothetical protein
MSLGSGAGYRKAGRNHNMDQYNNQSRERYSGHHIPIFVSLVKNVHKGSNVNVRLII